MPPQVFDHKVNSYRSASAACLPVANAKPHRGRGTADAVVVASIAIDPPVQLTFVTRTVDKCRNNKASRSAARTQHDQLSGLVGYQRLGELSP